MTPTADQVKAEIAALQELAKRLPNARRNLNIVIDALESEFTMNQVYDRYDTEDTEFQYALDAALWLCGESKDKPSQGWE